MKEMCFLAFKRQQLASKIYRLNVSVKILTLTLAHALISLPH